MKTILFNIKSYIVWPNNLAPSYMISIYRQDVRNQKEYHYAQLSYPGNASFRLITAARPQAQLIEDTELYVRGVRYQDDADLIEIQSNKLLTTFSELLIRPYAFDHERCVL